MTNKIAIIGGSGLYDVEEFKDREQIDLNTPWGKPSDKILQRKNPLYKNKTSLNIRRVEGMEILEDEKIKGSILKNDFDRWGIMQHARKLNPLSIARVRAALPSLSLSCPCTALPCLDTYSSAVYYVFLCIFTHHGIMPTVKQLPQLTLQGM